MLLSIIYATSTIVFIPDLPFRFFQFHPSRYRLITENVKDNSVTYLYQDINKPSSAIKVVCGNIYRSNIYKSVKTEVYFLETLSHKNIINGNYLGQSQTQESICLYMEIQYLEYDMFDYIVYRYQVTESNFVILAKLFELLIKELSSDILSALAYLHQNHIAHLDVKSENIMYSKGTYYLIDFDLAIETTGPNDVYDRVVGTRRYYSPELLIENYSMQNFDEFITYCKAYNPFASDMFSFGAFIAAFIFALFTNVKYDFNADQQIQCGHPFFNQAHPPFTKDFMDFIAKLIKCDPNERMTAQKALKHSFL
eukprot:NODE_705_length_4578_cov_0.471087.p2 type:complete len:310 gc:universal NODE_705_length_4578_cov_0.471087:3465-4394(+)